MDLSNKIHTILMTICSEGECYDNYESRARCKCFCVLGIFCAMLIFMIIMYSQSKGKTTNTSKYYEAKIDYKNDNTDYYNSDNSYKAYSRTCRSGYDYKY